MEKQKLIVTNSVIHVYEDVKPLLPPGVSEKSEERKPAPDKISPLLPPDVKGGQ